MLPSTSFSPFALTITACRLNRVLRFVILSLVSAISFLVSLMFARQSNTSRPAAMNTRVLAALDSLEASMRVDLRAAPDSTLADICKAVDSKLIEIRQEFGLLRHDLALGAGEGSNPASMFSDAAASIDLGHKTLQRVGQPDGDSSPLRISSVIPIDSVPLLLFSSPLLRAMAISPVNAHLKDLFASTIHTSVQGFVSPLRNTETTKLAIPFPFADQTLVIPSTLWSTEFTGASTQGSYASVCKY